uniref:Uncharacterized protein n=1 Tax=Arundo donax TaxID=35708 RepID=A0A0A8YVL1_ARUDO
MSVLSAKVEAAGATCKYQAQPRSTL